MWWMLLRETLNCGGEGGQREEGAGEEFRGGREGVRQGELEERGKEGGGEEEKERRRSKRKEGNIGGRDNLEEREEGGEMEG